MKEPRRLLHDDPGFGRLVDAMLKDGPSDVQMTKALSVANEVAALPSPGAAASWLARFGLPIGVTLVVIAGVAAAVVGSSAKPAERAASPASPPVSASSIATEVPEPPVASVRVDDLPSAPAARLPEPATVVASSRVGRVEGQAVGANHPGGTFAEELALASEARATLERGELTSCLAAVDRYQRRFRGGTFAQEIDVIRIEALARSGARQQARSAAEAFLRANGTSPYADRVRSVLENTK